MATDPDRAARLADEAEGVARSIISDFWQGTALEDIAGAVEATDPARGERVAQSITDKHRKAFEQNSAMVDTAIKKALAAKKRRTDG